MRKLNGIFKFLFSLLMVVTIFACEFPGGNPFDDEDWGDNIENNDSIPSLDDILPNDSILGGDDILPNDSIPGGDDILPNDSIVSPGNFHNGYEWVDLGLSVKWATCNVGAKKPEEFGGYYAWGDTQVKNKYSWETYKYATLGDDEVFMTKYCTDSEYGEVDNKLVLDSFDDVVHVVWGGNWRMPTKEELTELISNCSYTWTSLNGVNGVRLIARNGNGIFLPASGEYDYVNGYFGRIWSNTLDSEETTDAFVISFSDEGIDCYSHERYCGISVRPVCD